MEQLGFLLEILLAYCLLLTDDLLVVFSIAFHIMWQFNYIFWFNHKWQSPTALLPVVKCHT